MLSYNMVPRYLQAYLQMMTFSLPYSGQMASLLSWLKSKFPILEFLLSLFLGLLSLLSHCCVQLCHADLRSYILRSWSFHLSHHLWNFYICTCFVAHQFLSYSIVLTYSYIWICIFITSIYIWCLSWLYYSTHIPYMHGLDKIYLYIPTAPSTWLMHENLQVSVEWISKYA